MRRIFLRLLLLLFPVFVLLGMEAAARTYFFVRYSVPGHTYGTSKYDPVMGAIPRENSYSANAHLNNYGFRNSEDVFEPKPAGALRVITYGGSTTYCHHLRNNEAWPIRLQEELRQRRPGGSRDQVLNGGVIMWSLGHSFEKARRDVPLLKPDAVIIYTGVNEIYNANFLMAEGLPMKDLVARKDYGRFTTRLAFNTPFRNVITYKWMREKVFGPLQEMLRTEDRKSMSADAADPHLMENYLETLHAFVTFLRDNGVTPVVVREVFDPGNAHVNWNQGMTWYSTKGASVAAEWGAVVVDPTPAFSDPEQYSKGLFQTTGLHMTTTGAVLMASVIFDGAFRAAGK